MQVVAAFKILTSDPQVKALLVNIFGAAQPLPHNQSYSVHGGLMRSSPCQPVMGESCLTNRGMDLASSGK